MPIKYLKPDPSREIAKETPSSVFRSTYSISNTVHYHKGEIDPDEWNRPYKAMHTAIKPTHSVAMTNS